MHVHSAIMSKTSARIFASVLLAACLWFVRLPVLAQGLGGFAFESFTSDITLNKDGSFDVVETLQGEFFENRHGLFRNIPVRYEKPDGGFFTVPLDVQEVTHNGEEVNYEVYHEGPQFVVKIGDADRTVRGPFEYRIAYHVDRAILYHDNNDELYWNVTGTDWGESIPRVMARIRVPVDQNQELRVQCFTGAEGSRAQECEVGQEGNSAVVNAHDFLTVSVRFPKGVVEAPTRWEEFRWWLRDNWDKPFVAIILPGALLLLAWAWWRHGRDVKGRGTIIAEYEAPAGLSPTEVGALLDTKVHPRDFSAAIVDLAVRGYFQIIEKEEKGLLFGTNRVYTFKKLKEADVGFKPFENDILNALFEGGKMEASLSAQEVELAKARVTAEEAIPKDLAAQGYFAKHPQTIRNVFFILGAVTLVGGIYVGIAAAVDTDRFRVLGTFIVIGILLLILAPLMPKKTKKGALAFEHAKGFKLFLETAEKYRMQWKEKEGVFEKYLPYAMVFGVVEKWAAVFKDMNLPQPSWYVGMYPVVFNPMDFGKHMQSLGVATDSVKLPSSSGGGGGFGGGGFSGGGFGGGGGGSW